MGPGDLDALAGLWVDAWLATMPDIDFAARRGWIRDELARALAQRDVVLCAQDEAGAPAGFALLREHRTHLEQLAVRPDRFATGLGRALLDEAKRLSLGTLTLAVNQENPRAARFYQREGFVIVSEGVNPGGTRKIWTMKWTRP